MNKLLSKKTTFAYLAIALGLSFNAGADAWPFQSGNNQNQYSQQQTRNQNYYADSDENYSNNDSNESVSDRDLTKQIQDKLSSGIFSKGYSQVNFQVNKGVVTLQGSVKTLSDKEKLEKEIRNMKGVRGLNSQIQTEEDNGKQRQDTFAQDTYATNRDDQLNKKIRDNVSRGWLWDSYQDVVLNTSNGVVTLEGNVDTIGDQQKLMNEIQKINGVKSVKSNLKIKNRS